VGALRGGVADLPAAPNATAVPWIVIGGIAVVARGPMTTDIDAAVRGDQLDVASFLSRSSETFSGERHLGAAGPESGDEPARGAARAEKRSLNRSPGRDNQRVFNRSR